MKDFLGCHDAYAACVLSHVWLFATAQTVACQTLANGIFQAKYRSGLSIPTPGDLPIPGIKHESPASPALAGVFYTLAPPGKPYDH